MNKNIIVMVELNSLITLDGIVYKVKQSVNGKYVSVNEIISTDECVTVPSSIVYEGETLNVTVIDIAKDGTGDGKEVEVKVDTHCGYVMHSTYVPCYKKNTTLKHLTLIGYMEIETIMRDAFPKLQTIEVDMDFVKARAKVQLKVGLESFPGELIVPCTAREIFNNRYLRIVLMYHYAFDKSTHTSVRCKVPQMSSEALIMGDLIPVTLYFSGVVQYINKHEISQLIVVKNAIKDYSLEGHFFFKLIFSGVKITMRDGTEMNIVEDLETIRKYIG